MKKRFSLISGVLFFVAFLPYIWAITHRQTVPSPVSWAIWASVDTLALAAMLKERAVVGQLVGAVAGAWVITALALMFGKSTIGVVEVASIAITVIGIFLWKRPGGNAMSALVCSQVALLAGAIPTFVGAWRNPAQEDPVAWCTWFLSCVFALLAIPREKWDIANALQPICFMTIETVVVVLVVILPRLG